MQIQLLRILQVTPPHLHQLNHHLEVRIIKTITALADLQWTLEETWASDRTFHCLPDPFSIERKIFPFATSSTCARRVRDEANRQLDTISSREIRLHQLAISNANQRHRITKIDQFQFKGPQRPSDSRLHNKAVHNRSSRCLKECQRNKKLSKTR